MVSPLEHPLLHGVQVVAPLLGSHLGPCIIDIILREEPDVRGTKSSTERSQAHGRIERQIQEDDWMGRNDGKTRDHGRLTTEHVNGNELTREHFAGHERRADSVKHTPSMSDVFDL